MNSIMFVVYHDLKTEARSQEILKCGQLMGNCYLVTYSDTHLADSEMKFITSNGKRKYLQFLLKSFWLILKKRPNVLILHDNYTSPILFFVKLFKIKTKIIYDSSELYIDVKPKSFKGRLSKVFQVLENKFLKYADLVIAANIERAKIMKKYFKLNSLPIIFDNKHIIDEDIDFENCNRKYGHLFKKNRFTILYAGGISKERKTFELIDAVIKLGHKYQLIIIGQAGEKQKKKFDNTISLNESKNIYYLGFLQRSEFKYLLDKSKISVSAFDQNTLNNKYCESGKIYESIYSKVPILVTENPPLKRLCRNHKVGISTSNFYEGILNIERQYDFYKSNIKKYISKNPLKDRIDKLYIQIKNNLDI